MVIAENECEKGAKGLASVHKKSPQETPAGYESFWPAAYEFLQQHVDTQHIQQQHEADWAFRDVMVV